MDACLKGEGMIALNLSAIDPYEIVWSTGAKGAIIENLSAGEYTATITDGAGCQVIISQIIQNVAPISLADAKINPITCHGSENGSIEVILHGGNFPYETQWSNGETTLAIDGLATGTHTLEVVDAKGCVKTFDFDSNDLLLEWDYEKITPNCNHYRLLQMKNQNLLLEVDPSPLCYEVCNHL